MICVNIVLAIETKSSHLVGFGDLFVEIKLTSENNKKRAILFPDTSGGRDVVPMVYSTDCNCI